MLSIASPVREEVTSAVLSGGEVTGLASTPTPTAVEVVTTDPASTSSCETGWVPRQVVLSPARSRRSAHTTPPTSRSVTVTSSTVMRPVLVTRKS